ncbi:hypothetical protein LTR97_011163 [Elasticomyces elasticus]|uniref:HTH OST-type domain-containing protein n=1 Tax=Elasticomyces elasticus TaxID=574655 RepID=A0AAN7ZL67_9PEZI|nr:hypothetical protein LTR97_011163 [Elasticomyces elasticus]
MADKSGHLALLIDGDNVSPKIIVGLMAEIANYGTASVRRIYGDWTRPDLKGWKSCLLDHLILPMQQFAYTKGKNSTDGAMIIDAMDLLYTNRFSAFCIVSSDSDFTRLAARIREQGVTVYGFGERTTVTAFIAACDKFVYFDVLGVPFRKPEDPITEDVSTSLAAKTVGRLEATAPALHHPQVSAGLPLPRRPLDQAALDGLATAIRNTSGYEGGEYADLAHVGDYLGRISPGLNPRNYGYSRLKTFVEASGIANLKRKAVGNNGEIVLVCLKRDVAENAGLQIPMME